MIDLEVVKRATGADRVGMIHDINYRVWTLTVLLPSGQWIAARQDDPWTTEGAIAWIRPLTWAHDRQPVAAVGSA